jgi:hypothetical protein
VTPPEELPNDNDPRDEINEADELRAEDARRKYDARMEEMDRRDRAGPHWQWW